MPDGAQSPDEFPIRFDLLTANPVYKPFRYPWAYDAWLTQQRIHWLPEEVPLADDVKDWQKNLTASERNLLTQIFRFFTQADVEVNNCYMKQYSQVFKPTEVLMMMSAFSNTETIHIAAYSHLLDTIGMPEIEYTAFLKYKEMKDKYDYMQSFKVDSKVEIAKTLAAFGAFTEGLQLFASFAILMNFPRFNKMKGMGQIVSWSVRDETLHCLSVIRLFRTFVQENPEIWTEELRRDLYLSAPPSSSMRIASSTWPLNLAACRASRRRASSNISASLPTGACSNWAWSRCFTSSATPCPGSTKCSMPSSTPISSRTGRPNIPRPAPPAPGRMLSPRAPSRRRSPRAKSRSRGING